MQGVGILECRLVAAARGAHGGGQSQLWGCSAGGLLGDVDGESWGWGWGRSRSRSRDCHARLVDRFGIGRRRYAQCEGWELVVAMCARHRSLEDGSGSGRGHGELQRKGHVSQSQGQQRIEGEQQEGVEGPELAETQPGSSGRRAGKL